MFRVSDELQRDLRRAQDARGGHVVHARDGGELLLQRRGHRGRHGVRAGARIEGGDEDGGQVHVRQVAHRQFHVRHDAEEQQAGHDQRGHDRPADEHLGKVHEAEPFP